MFNWQPFLDLINSKDCTHEYNLLNFSDLKKVAKTFFKNAKYQSEKKEKENNLFSKIFLVPMSYIYIYLLIKAGTARVPLRAGWEREWCKEKWSSVKWLLRSVCRCVAKLGA